MGDEAAIASFEIVIEIGARIKNAIGGRRDEWRVAGLRERMMLAVAIRRLWTGVAISRGQLVPERAD